jgi:hypothetical protein
MNTADYIVKAQYNYNPRRLTFIKLQDLPRSQWSLKSSLSCKEGMPGRKWVGLSDCREYGPRRYPVMLGGGMVMPEPTTSLTPHIFTNLPGVGTLLEKKKLVLD